MGVRLTAALGLCLVMIGCIEAEGMPDADITRIGGEIPFGASNANQSITPFTTHLTVTPDPNNPAVTAGVTLSPLLAPSRCVDVPNGASTNGVPLGLWDCNGYGAAQLWSWSNGTLRIQGGKKCLVVGSPDILQATTVVITDCSTVSAAPQQGVWNYVNGLVQAGTANRCLQVGDSTGSRGVALTLAPCSSPDPRQRWGIDNHDANYLRGSIITISTNNASCLDVLGGNPADGTQVEIYGCNFGPPQQWLMEGLEIRAVGKCLAVSAADPTLVEIDTCDGSDAQKWTLNAGQIQRVVNNNCLELPNGDTTNLTRVKVLPCTGASQQQWVWGGSG